MVPLDVYQQIPFVLIKITHIREHCILALRTSTQFLRTIFTQQVGTLNIGRSVEVRVLVNIHVDSSNNSYLVYCLVMHHCAVGYCKVRSTSLPSPMCCIVRPCIAAAADDDDDKTIS